MLDDLAGIVLAVGFATAVVPPMRSLIFHGRREREFQLRWLKVGAAVFALGLLIAVIDALINGKPLV